MKTNRTIKNFGLVLLVIASGLQSAYAAYYQFVVGNVLYEIIGASNEVMAMQVPRDPAVGDVVIPSQVRMPGSSEYYTVVSLRDSAFYNCGEITTITLPATVTSLGHHAFENCFSLTAIHVEEGSPWVEREGVLYNPEMTEIVQAPTGIKGDFVVPSGVERIGKNAFYSACSLRRVVLNEGLVEVCDGAFQNCWSLSDVQFPTTLRRIGAWAFDGTILQFMLFHPNLDTIGDGAFCHTSMVEVMLLGSNPPVLGNDVFGDDMGYTRLYVPVGSKATYQRTPWTVFPVFYEGNKSRRWVGKKR